MALSEFYPELKGWTSVNPNAQTIPPAPQIPNDQTQVSGYLRTTLPLPLQYSPDTLKQYNRPGLSSFRIAPLPPSGLPSVNSASQSVTTTSIHEFVTVAAAGPNSAVQFNNGGALGGVSQFEWNNLSSVLSINGSLVVTTPIAVTYGGTGSNLSATGGAHEVLLQETLGGVVTVRQLTFADISGSLVNIPIWRTISKSSSYAAIAGDMVLVDSSGGPITITIPASASNSNLSIRVKKISSDANDVTMARTGADLIDGQTSQVISFQYTDVEITADGGTNWWIA